MTDRYPPSEPYDTGHLDVGDGNSLYWETSGNPDGVPALHLHGGPGGGSGPVARRYFDPQAYRFVQFDQRGCGKSRPLADEPSVDLSTNTTGHLVADIEALREFLGIDRWVVFGLSWGVTLGLVYAQAHPDRVRGMVLGAVTSGTRRESEWITRDMGRIFPGKWEEFVAGVPVTERDGDLAAAYGRLLADPDAGVRAEAARAWCAWEDVHVSLMPGWQPNPRFSDPTFCAVFARLVTHYWSHACFLVDGQVLSAMPRLAGIPAALIHGRHDISGPPDIAWKLHRAWPGSTLEVLEDAGHGGGGFPDRLTDALNRFRHLA